jgi:hypothetical protein
MKKVPIYLIIFLPLLYGRALYSFKPYLSLSPDIKFISLNSAGLLVIKVRKTIDYSYIRDNFYLQKGTLFYSLNTFLPAIEDSNSKYYYRIKLRLTGLFRQKTVESLHLLYQIDGQLYILDSLNIRISGPEVLIPSSEWAFLCREIFSVGRWAFHDNRDISTPFISSRDYNDSASSRCLACQSELIKQFFFSVPNPENTKWELNKKYHHLLTFRDDYLLKDIGNNVKSGQSEKQRRYSIISSRSRAIINLAYINAEKKKIKASLYYPSGKLFKDVHLLRIENGSYLMSERLNISRIYILVFSLHSHNYRHCLIVK